ncbi:hypothetical protein ACFT9M_22010 [Micromonospora purpureochromogenes]|uniref:hypothetical protein n=1 Tax=Micromonospora purpureochromogenes TaxID=47872 RepID=UPI0036324941
MRLSRIIMALTAGLAVVLAPTAAGAAQPQPAPGVPQPPPDYVPQPASLTANRTTIVIGQTVVLTGTNFGPNEIVDIDVSLAPLAASVPGQPARRSDGSTVAMAAVAYPQPAPRHFTAYTNAQGRFTKSYRPTEVGQLTFTATGRESGRTASVTITVLPKKKPGGGNQLPVTGDSMGTPLKVGGGLVGAGAVLMLGSLVWRRRNRFGMGSPR